MVNVKQLRVAELILHISNRELYCAGQHLILTGLEFDLLHLLMRHAGEVLSRQQIAAYIFKRGTDCCDASINMHISNIRKKLVEHGQANVIKTIRGRGYLIVGC